MKIKDCLKVKDLIEILKEIPPDTHILLQRDPEGNGFSPLSYCYTEKFKITRFAHMYDCKLDYGSKPQLSYGGKTPKIEIIIKGKEAVILAPIL